MEGKETTGERILGLEGSRVIINNPHSYNTNRVHGQVKSVEKVGDWNWILKVQSDLDPFTVDCRFPISCLDGTLYFEDRYSEINLILRQLFEYERLASRSIESKKIASIDEFKNRLSYELNKEIYRTRSDNKSRLKILFGKKQIPDEETDDLIYIFETERDIYIPENTRITIYQNIADYYGTIIQCEDREITIATKQDFGDEVEQLEIELDFTWLQAAEEKCFYKACSSPTPLTRTLILEGPKQVDSRKMIQTGQAEAVKKSVSEPITCVWGPPGTGKTTTLCRMILEKALMGENILMTSFSNVSVDAALIKLLEIIDSDKRFEEFRKPGKIIRLGRARKKEVIDHEFITLDSCYQFQIQQKKDQAAQYLKLLEQFKSIEGITEEEEKQFLKRMTSKLLKNEWRGQIYSVQQLEDEIRTRFDTTSITKSKIESEAVIIFATASTMTLRAEKNQRMFNSVIFDEISMATLPKLAIISNMASEHLVCLGDFNQLPPVASGVLETDVFRYMGIYDAVQDGYYHDWLVMLDTQYRMHSDIADFIGSRLYKNMLKTGEGVDSSLKPITMQAPFKDRTMILADCSNMMTVCKVLPSKSRVNLLSALFCIQLALKFGENCSVAIIAPYRAQADLINSFLIDFDKNLKNQGYRSITASTVHQFQGSESDVVILDLVDCYRAAYISSMLGSNSGNSIADRLMNVSMSRAKGKLIILGNRDFFKEKGLNEKLLLNQFFFRQRNDNYRGIQLIEELLAGSQSESELLFTKDNIAFRHYAYTDKYTHDSSNPWRQLLLDLSQVKKEIRIDLPGRASNSSVFKGFVTTLVSHIESNSDIPVILRAENVIEWPIELQKYIAQSQDVTDPVVVIDRKIFWYGMPPVRNAFKMKSGEIHAATEYPIFRAEGKFLCQNITSLLRMRSHEEGTYRIDGLKKTIDEAAEKINCRYCDSPLTLSLGRFGAYLVCRSENKCPRPDKQTLRMILKNLLKDRPDLFNCPICGQPMTITERSNKYFFQCSGEGEHNFDLQQLL